MRTAELDALRAAVNSVLTETCTIQTKGEQVGAAGGRRAVYTDTPSACLIVALGSADKTLYADKLGGASGYKIRLPWDAVVSISDRISAGDQVYEILAILHQTPNTVIQAICRVS